MQEGQHDKDSWNVDMRDVSQQFAYWSMVMDLEMLHCRFVCSLREGDFDLYVHVIDELLAYLVSHLFISLQSHPDFDLWMILSSLRIRKSHLRCEIKGC